MPNTVFTRDLPKSDFNSLARGLAAEADVAVSTARACLLGQFNIARDSGNAVAVMRGHGMQHVGGLVLIPRTR